MALNKEKFLRIFCLGVMVLALVRCAFPSIAEHSNDKMVAEVATDSMSCDANAASSSLSSQLIQMKNHVVDSVDTYNTLKPVFFSNSKGEFSPHKIYSVSSYDRAFPDSNHVQLVCAKYYGVSPVKDRQEAEARKQELVFAQYSPYYEVKKMKRGIPYLVPRAYVLLQDIGRNFFDSLAIKGLPLHKIVVTSILRTEDDVATLRKHNGNATQNSCHMYGTTFDISYNSFVAVDDINGKPMRKVRQDSLKWILSEVMNDLRKQNRCYVKYEKNQSCFHATVR